MVRDAELTLYANGIDAATGEYLAPPLTPHEVARIAQGEPIDREHLEELKSRKKRERRVVRAVREGIDPRNLADTGWGVIFASDADPALKDAMCELIEHRQSQAASKAAKRFQIYEGENGYRAGESKNAFLSRHGAGPGPADPERVPYYLLIVGGPDAIPYAFQYQLDVQYAVGRIHFDTPAEYAAYAHTVVSTEKATPELARAAAFFGPHNADDRSTALSAEHLVAPLGQWFAGAQAGWQAQTIVGEAATKARLARLLGGEETPAFLFTASHGMSFPNGHALQYRHQGALLCQDWPGPQAWQKPIPEDHYFSADDLPTTAGVGGRITFHFACYGAGTPAMDDFAMQAFKERTAIAPRAFVAGLPRRLLAHPKAGALAVIGHVERAWGCSFLWDKAGEQLAVFQDMLKRLVQGHPVGSAMEPFNTRYAELASDLNTELEDCKFGKKPDEYALAGMWTANNDARAYVILGDPAVRLPLQ